MTRKPQDSTPVRYVGNAKRRTVNGYEWNAENGYVQTVREAALVKRLVANGDFVVVDAPDASAQKHEEQGT